MSEYDNWEHGDYLVVITPENMEDLAQAIRDDNPNFPTYVFYNFAREVLGEEMLFSEFVDRLHQALQDEIDAKLQSLVSDGVLKMSCTDEGDIVMYDPNSIEQSSDESELENSE